jgi:hypothetical protein
MTDGYTISALFPAIRQSLEGVKILTRYYSCGMLEEFKHRLQDMKRVNRFNVLVFGFHGGSGMLRSETKIPISLEDLAEIMKEKYRGFAVHFASCKTLNTDISRIWYFKNKTGVRAVSGYTVNSGWDEHVSALELVLLSRYLRGRNKLDKIYAKQAKQAGLVVL